VAAKLKKNVSALLAAGDLESLKALALGGQGVVRTLVSLLYSEDETLRWQAIAALGEVSAALAETNSERVLDLIRRLFWSLNDESGGIGWHVPEALGELLFRVPRFAPTFGPPLATHLDIEPFGPGVLWAIGRLSQLDPRLVAFVLPGVRKLLEHGDPLVRGRAAWSLGQARDAEAAAALASLADSRDEAPATVFEGGRLRLATVGALAAEALQRISRSGR
jgi:HEAT repeat protein